MKRISYFLVGMVFSVLLVSGCKQAATLNKEAISADSVAAPSHDSAQGANWKLNNIARFVSGLPVDKSSELFDLTQTPEWKTYEAEATVAWARFDSVAKKYHAFSKAEITAPYDTIKTLFYPFSGPDFLFANIMFPNVEKMILIGLEGPGSIPQIDAQSKDSLKTILGMYKVAIEDVIQLSFFRTIDMKNELGNRAIDGTAPIMMLFLARSGKEVVSVTPMYLDKEGKLVPVAEAKTKKQATAVELVYRNPGEEKLRSIIYLSTNVADPSLSQNGPFLKFLKSIDYNCATFVKSATYLMHKSYFSIIRNTSLEHSAIILQDDSGIGFKFFDHKKWDIQLYGTYSKPIKLFEDFYEADYFEAFKTTKVKPLRFRIGYSPKSNLLMAKRK